MFDCLKRIPGGKTIISVALSGAELAINGIQKQHIRAAAVLAMAFLVNAYTNQSDDLDLNEWASIALKTAGGLGGAELITCGLCYSSQKVQNYAFNIIKKRMGLGELPNETIKMLACTGISLNRALLNLNMGDLQEFNQADLEELISKIEARHAAELKILNEVKLNLIQETLENSALI